MLKIKINLVEKEESKLIILKKRLEGTIVIINNEKFFIHQVASENTAFGYYVKTGNWSIIKINKIQK